MVGERVGEVVNNYYNEEGRCYSTVSLEFRLRKTNILAPCTKSY